ncbi:hypothetical protein [Alloprevotella tannerae]|jgi:hypothetical protein|uniref:hypothetical protein n=1 Tax=Alloprevotella tannerae TaxID=76122 RepID=UPI0028EF0661|nr:hypothetical protein [Alloprevotella tannerae]
MKHKLILEGVITLVLLLGLSVKKSYAQGQDAQHVWKGNSIEDIINAGDPDMQTVYLYNVGTHKFINAGGYWATVTIGYNVGMALHIKKSTKHGAYYNITGDTQTSEGSTIAWGRKQDTTPDGQKNPINYNNVYVDRGTVVDPATHKLNGIIDWEFEETYIGSKTYTIHCFNDEVLSGNENMHGKIYLQLEHSVADRLEMKYPHRVETSDRTAQWKIVTLKDLKDAFKETFASDEKPADATFLIRDQNFSRSHKEIKKWEISDGLTEHYKPSNYSFETDNGTYYVGIGSPKSDAYQAKYAARWVATIRNIGDNAHANGSVTQKVKILKKGWYILSCDGFCSADKGSKMKSSFFAKVEGYTRGSSCVSVELEKFRRDFTYTVSDLTKTYDKDDVGIESPYVQAGRVFNEGKYQNSLIVYVPSNGAILNIGVEVKGSNQPLDLTAFDNFQLHYCGDRDIVLDETQTNKDYINKQVEVGVAKTLILKRSMTPYQWNSITLPVALTAAQFKIAFGRHAELSKLKGQDENLSSRVVFTPVDLTDDDKVVIEPDKLYIMKPTRWENVTYGDYTKIIDHYGTITVQAPYYLINGVSLTEQTTGEFKEQAKHSTTVDGQLQFCGTQVKRGSGYVPKYSYVLGAKDGKWHYLDKDHSILGFRCWIATGSAGLAKQMTFSINGVVDNTTGINQTIVDNPRPQNADIYTVNGQLVRAGSSSIEGLPKGIYIVNGKKLVVR